jgi:single-stranded DNA-binding protein
VDSRNDNPDRRKTTMPNTPTLTLTGHLGRDVQCCLTTPKEYTRMTIDPILEEEVEVEETTPVREYARLSLAVNEGLGRSRRTTWHQLRVWNLDDQPFEAKVRAARKGQRIEIQGRWEEHRYTDRKTGEEKVFRYITVTSFRTRPGKLLRPKLSAAA